MKFARRVVGTTRAERWALGWELGCQVPMREINVRSNAPVLQAIPDPNPPCKPRGRTIACPEQHPKHRARNLTSNLRSKRKIVMLELGVQSMRLQRRSRGESQSQSAESCMKYKDSTPRASQLKVLLHGRRLIPAREDPGVLISSELRWRLLWFVYLQLHL